MYMKENSTKLIAAITRWKCEISGSATKVAYKKTIGTWKPLKVRGG